ncbi:cupin domain-containing protein [uncultured Mitsuokella sp.]|uniref:cupin domain-containing protein n=1 Tax=uncultured Mitsuokella sp. TaxID=453120 RepID=UPI0026197EEB|nr:cupin domain-containing protein [uncultured Mitsuokella sp.]
MACIEAAPVQATNKAGGNGTITIVKLLTPAELDGKCDMFAKVILPPQTSIGVHEHKGNTETYHILSGTALYNDNGKEASIGAGATTFCPDGEKHGIANPSKTEDLVFMALIIKK